MSVIAPQVTTQAAPRRGFRRFWVALKQLFHEVIGGIFAVLALFWLQNMVRAWSRDGARWLIGTSLGLALLMAVFSFTSFRAAKKLQAS